MYRLSSRGPQVTGSAPVDPIGVDEPRAQERARARISSVVAAVPTVFSAGAALWRLEAESAALRCSTTTSRPASADGILLRGHQARPVRLLSPRAGHASQC